MFCYFYYFHNVNMSKNNTIIQSYFKKSVPIHAQSKDEASLQCGVWFKADIGEFLLICDSSSSALSWTPSIFT